KKIQITFFSYNSCFNPSAISSWEISSSEKICFIAKETLSSASDVVIYSHVRVYSSCNFLYNNLLKYYPFRPMSIQIKINREFKLWLLSSIALHSISDFLSYHKIVISSMHFRHHFGAHVIHRIIVYYSYS